MRILPEILQSAQSIAQIRRSIHAHPELRFEENRTAELVAEALSSWGIPVFKGLGKTGVVGRIDGELGPGKMIGLRADMDALPLQEKNTFPHASTHAGKMHACGHDGHTAMLLGTPRELSAQLSDCGAETILLLEHFGKTLEDAFAIEGQAIALKHVVITSIAEMLGWKGPWLDRFIRTFKRKVVPYVLPNHLQSIQFSQALERGAQLSYQKPAISQSDIALLQYTGGTTGISKGAILTHRNLIANVMQIEAWLKPIQQRKTIEAWHFLCALPMYHIFALTGCGLLGMRLGARILLVPNARDLPNLIGILKEFPEINVFPGVNTLFQALLNNSKFTDLDFSRWALTIGGGMAVQRSVAERWQALTGTVITEGYGLSETSPVASCNTPLAQEFTGSIGLPLPDTEMCIRDEDERDLVAGQVGEIYIRGPQVMSGYWQQESETSNVLGSDGYF
ncbi:MAG: M20/M25/M40 family metallo-hydrolase, partial [Burkholderiaceae bacterium]|nr:M20/M25/M40 family metallo-hydrolase [Burkholderiaceae bacterium]